MITVKNTIYSIADMTHDEGICYGSTSAAQRAYFAVTQDGVVTFNMLRRAYFVEVIKEEVARHTDDISIDPESLNEETYIMLQESDIFLMEFCKRNFLAVMDEEGHDYIIGAQIFIYNKGKRYIQTEIADYLDVFDTTSVYDNIALEFYGSTLGCRI